MTEYMGKIIDGLELPEKFLLSGHSCGGYLATLFASKWPERVDQLFLISPGGTEPYDEESYEPYKFRDMDDVTQRFVSKAKVEEFIAYRDDNRNMLVEKTQGLPRFVLYHALSKPRWTKHTERLSKEF